MCVVRGGPVRGVGCPPALTNAQVMVCVVRMVMCVSVKMAIQVCTCNPNQGMRYCVCVFVINYFALTIIHKKFNRE